MRFSISGTMNLSWDEARNAAQLAEDLGFDDFYSSDHLMAVAGFDAEKGLLDAVGVLVALAAVTKRIRLGCLVSPITYRNPFIMLRQIQTLDLVSGGRAIMGLGAGWNETEHKLFGFPFPAIGERIRMLDDACRMTRERWSQLRPRAVQEQVRLLVAGASPGLLRIAARHADAWHAIGTPALLAERIAALRDAERAAGRDPARPLETTVNMMATVSGDEAKLAAVRERIVRAGRTPGSERAQNRVALPGDANPSGMFVGRPEELRREIELYAKAGVDRVIFALPRPFSRESLTFLATAAGLVA